MIETNLTGPWLMSTLAYNMWMRDNGGSIVVITAAPHDRVGDPVRPQRLQSQFRLTFRSRKVAENSRKDELGHMS